MLFNCSVHEDKCLYKDQVHLIEETLTLSELIRLEIHGPESELDKLREPLAYLSPQSIVYRDVT